jgi:endoglucanase
MKKIIGISFIIISIGIAVVVWYMNSKYSTVTREFSQYTLLASAWDEYKQRFINSDGRVIDYSADSITTSEGQSYALLRAVWMDDQQTFDLVWKWTSVNLDRPDDALFGWRWGERDDGSYGYMPDGGENSASDADQDIALALILASRRWNNSKYETEAKKILESLWEVNTATANGKRYMIAGNWAQNKDELVLNPSYFGPYAWRIFDQVDTEHDWLSLVDPAYELLTLSGTEPLDTGKGVGLPPDWVTIRRDTGELRATSQGNLKTTYSFDAMRTPWRIALDYKWNKDERAIQYLEKSFSHLYTEYTQKGTLSTSYSHNGDISIQGENPSMYATAIGYFIVLHPDLAKRIYEEKIIGVYSNDENSFRTDLPYYEQNWLWFGAAMYHNFLSMY